MPGFVGQNAGKFIFGAREADELSGDINATSGVEEALAVGRLEDKNDTSIPAEADDWPGDRRFAEVRREFRIIGFLCIVTNDCR